MIGGCAGTAGGCGGSGKVLLSKNVIKDCSNGSNLSGILLPPLDLPQCYAEENMLYKVEDVGGSALGTSSQATWEECRSHCRYHQTINLHHRMLKWFFSCRDTYEDAEFFTYNRRADDNNCPCKPDMDVDAALFEAAWKEKRNRVSGNVKCDGSGAA